MFTKLSLLQRFQIGLILALAFLLVLGSNRVDRRHFSTVQNTVNSVHDDRVVVQDFIYRLNNIFHQKELLLVQNKPNTDIATENTQIDELLTNFGATKLTTKESRLLNQLNQQFDKLKGLENRAPTVSDQDSLGLGNNISETSYKVSTPSDKKMLATLEDINQSLEELSEIQLAESKQLTQLSNKSLGMNILLSNLEVGFIIVIGIAMLVLIFYPSNTRISEPSQN